VHLSLNIKTLILALELKEPMSRSLCVLTNLLSPGPTRNEERDTMAGIILSEPFDGPDEFDRILDSEEEGFQPVSLGEGVSNVS
jgi:hypothetical protein